MTYKTKPFYIKDGKAFVNIAGEMNPTKNIELIGYAVLDLIEFQKKLPITRFIDYLEANNKQLSQERKEVFNQVLEDRLISVNTLFKKINVTRQTINAVLKILEDAGVIKNTNIAENTLIGKYNVIGTMDFDTSSLTNETLKIAHKIVSDNEVKKDYKKEYEVCFNTFKSAMITLIKYNVVEAETKNVIFDTYFELV